jgi:predicted kinase
MQTVYIMTGIAGSGKSTWILENKSPSSIVISKDNIRQELWDKEDEYFDNEKEVKTLFYSQLENALQNYNTVYIDGVNLTVKSRRRILSRIPQNVKKISVFVDVDLETALKQNSNRTGRARVPQEAIEFHYRILQVPTLDEGFEELIRV